ncbi:hypothetical protein Afil01_35170 [Actinorhabdospora filicis]|uniref:ABC transporter ATP-binding protein n=1 Tax=Actinorhabdospora filicis TaxID=1785913 RepID=A0A9W6WBG5_9ACTN|nr:ABC transporter ATP-binding protein [Actinorhabdospora filicis]GLZ78710.1 hypothetical protein Afil01_35170 [Actinorhabdospora filicis]
MRRLARLAGLAPLPSALTLVCQAAGQAAAIAVPAVLAVVVDGLLSGSPGLLWPAALAGLLLGQALADAAAGVASAGASSRVTARLRGRLARHVLALGVPGSRRHDTGDLVARLAGNATAAGRAVPAVAATLLAAVTTVAGAVALWLLDWRLGAVFLAGTVPAVLLLRRLTGDIGASYAGYLERLGAIAGRLAETVGGARTVRASGTSAHEIGRILEPLPGLREAGASTWAAQRAITWRVDLLITVFRLAVLTTAGFGVWRGWLSPGGFVAAALYLGIAMGFLDQVDNLVTLAEAGANAGRVSELLDEEAPAAREPSAGDGPATLSLRGVRVEGVLDGLDLEIPAGACVAVVGRSGAGKSTLALLAGGLLEPDAGEVLVGGAPVARGQVSYAFDRPVLLGETVADAIAYGRPHLNGEVGEAARAAQADAFVRRLPEGYATPLAEAPLSGGELQRLGLARAIAHGGRVLVLDDATSGLDTVTEARVASALDGLAGRTRLVIAHRAGTAARADLVAWLDEGRIAALGRHEDLWRDHPGYRDLLGRTG